MALLTVVAPPTTLTKLGPFDVAALSRNVVADVVVNHRVPVIAKQVVDGVPRCAVVLNMDNLKLLCAGCFKEGMALADDSQCRTCTGFVKHWTTKNGEQNWKCKPAKETIWEVAKGRSEVVLDFGGGDISGWTTDDLIMELKRRNAQKEALKAASDDDILRELEERDLATCAVKNAPKEDLARTMRANGIKPLFDARRVELIHELQRQARDSSIEGHFCNHKKRDWPHGASHEVGIDIVDKSKDVLHKT